MPPKALTQRYPKEPLGRISELSKEGTQRIVLYLPAGSPLAIHTWRETDRYRYEILKKRNLMLDHDSAIEVLHGESGLKLMKRHEKNKCNKKAEALSAMRRRGLRHPVW